MIYLHSTLSDYPGDARSKINRTTYLNCLPNLLDQDLLEPSGYMINRKILDSGKTWVKILDYDGKSIYFLSSVLFEELPEEIKTYITVMIIG